MAILGSEGEVIALHSKVRGKWIEGGWEESVEDL